MRGYDCLQTDWTEDTEAYASRISSEVVSLNEPLWLMPFIHQCRNSGTRHFSKHRRPIQLTTLAGRLQASQCLQLRSELLTIRFYFDCESQLRNRLVRLALIGQDYGQVVPCLSVVGIQLDG